MAHRIFISYRREDSESLAPQIYDALTRDFGEGEVFMDVDSMAYGRDFRRQLTDALADCEVVLAIVGPDWGDRLKHPNDFVRLELEEALKQELRIIPVFVKRVRSIPMDVLPSSLEPVAFRHGLPFRMGTDRKQDLRRISRAVEEVLTEHEEERQAEARRTMLAVLQEQQRQAEAERQARLAEEARRQEEEAQRLAEEQAEEERRAEFQRKAEARRRIKRARQRAEAERKAEAKRQAEAERQARREEEARREAEARVKAEQEAAAKRREDARREMEQRREDARRKAELKRQAEERRAEEQRKRDAEKKRAAQEKKRVAQERYLRGRSLYDDARFESAHKELLSAAQNGHAVARHLLGQMYERGLGVAHNQDEAQRYYRLSARGGVAQAKLDLQRLRGGSPSSQSTPQRPQTSDDRTESFLRSPIGIASASFAFLFFVAAVAISIDSSTTRSDRSLRYLSPTELVSRGYEASQAGDYDEAVRFYRLAAEQGDATAQANLGYLYESGQGVEQDYDEAIRLYELAADQNEQYAQYNLGRLHENGLGVLERRSIAIQYYRLAAGQGHRGAQDALERLGVE